MQGPAPTSDPSSPPPPPASDERVASLHATDALGALHTLIAASLTASSIALSRSPNTAIWLSGQALFAVGFVKWFSLLHEAGHNTLFASRPLNALVGRAASVISVIPYSSWKAIHRMHHKWTGWQDKDPTTTSLVPRRLGAVETWTIRIAWALWLPLFSVLYRTQSFWHFPRLFRLFEGSRARRAFVLDALGLVAVYAACSALVGPAALARLVGLGLLLGFSWMDVIMLSQHTHIPLQIAGDGDVKPIPAPEQAPYTRSLRFSSWLSSGALTGFDAHELHHVFPFVPGPLLRRIPWTPPNEAPAWAWIRAAKAVPADVFLFQNRKTSGLSV